jgi:SAM-dependent methyltransferase
LSYPERIIPDEEPAGVVALHLARYAFARPYCAAKLVLDAACGAGYGTAFLAAVAKRVVGVDVDAAAIDYARSRYAAPNVEFDVMDITALRFADAAFDVVCAFEAIEHVADGGAFVRETARVLREDGLLAVSTPQARETTHVPRNPYHRVEYSRDDFEQLLRTAFEEVTIYGQRRLQTRRHRLLLRLDVLGLRRRLPFLQHAAVLTGSAPTPSLTLDDIVISPHDVETAGELVAVCTRPYR